MGDLVTEASLAKHLAAESIQTTFRRYMECRAFVRKRKMFCSENLVKNLAAETITKGIRSLSRSRSRMHSEVSSVQNGEVASLTSKSFTAEFRELPPKSRNIVNETSLRVLRITNLMVENVAGVVWQGKNNLYCSLRLLDWMHRTPTAPEAADTAQWLDESIEFPLRHTGHDHTKPLGLLGVSIYHESLVVEDKLIAHADIPLISIFEGEVSSNQFTCETAVDVEQTAFDGTKFKKKSKGLVKFSAQILFSHFDESQNRTKRMEATPSQVRDQRVDLQLDSTSGSIITQSIDPDNMRDDSMYDFSSTQLRDAVNILQEWEAPAESAAARVKPATTKSISTPLGRSASRPGSGANLNNLKSDTLKAHNKPVNPVPGKTAAASAAIIAPPPPVIPIAAPSSSHKAVPPVRDGGAGSEKRAARDGPREPTGDAPPRDDRARTAPVVASATSRPSSAGATGKASTRLRNRRTSADDSANSTLQGDQEVGTVRRGSAKPATDLVSLKSSETATKRLGSTSSVRSDMRAKRYGESVVDEAFRLAIKAKGAFLKLNLAEFANLLDFLNFPVNSKLLDPSVPISNLQENAVRVSESSGSNNRQEEVSIPIVHAMSVAATISFLVRDHHLLSDDHVPENVTPLSPLPVGVMNEEKSERVLAQLVALVEGSYPDAKAFIFKKCDSVDNRPVSKNRVTSTGGKGSPIEEPCRPAMWSTAVVHAFLKCINIHCTAGEADLLDGQRLLSMDSSALRTCFGANPSIDRTRLQVYLQTLQFLDSWWDRGIRPGEAFRKEFTADPEDPSVVSGTTAKRNKSKRRGSKSGYGPIVAKWGDLSAVLDTIQDNDLSETIRSRSKVVDGGRAIHSHLLKVADFQVLLESLNPLNRAFGWGCSMESLVRFASIVGGMRGHLWVQDDSLLRRQSSANSSFSDLKQLENADESALSAQDAIGRWVVLQKGSANSTTELTQLVRLCQELRVVIKYTSREDDFIAFIPLACLRVTSVQEVRASAFHAALEGLLLDDICVGKKVVVAGIDALVRTCERFDWWDRPPAAVMEGMSNQVGEVVSLAEAQSKRRVGVRIYNSGVCDALPLEALRLCSDAEYNQVMEDLEAKKAESEMENENETELKRNKTSRRKSKAFTSIKPRDKTRLRTLIKSINVQEDVDKAGGEADHRPPAPPSAPVRASKLSSKYRAFEEVASKSELSNLSGDELTPPPRSSPPKKKKPSAAAVSPQKKITKRVMVRNDPHIDTTTTNREQTNDVSIDLNEQNPNYARSAATSAFVHSRARVESPTDESLWSEMEPPVIDYSWLKGAPRSPIVFSEEISSPTTNHDGNGGSAAAAHPTGRDSAEVKRHTPERKLPSGVAPLHIIRPGFDLESAEYTVGVPKVHLDLPAEDEAVTNRLQSKFVRSNNRPQSAPSTGHRTKRATAENASKAPPPPPSPMQDPEARTSFGLSGKGYEGSGQLKQHSNQWVNEDIPVFSEAEIPKVIPNKTPIHSTDYRTSTNKLFEFNKKNLAPEVDHRVGGNHFGNAPELMVAQKEALSPGRRTTAVPQRPSSAGATGRGVTNPNRPSGNKSLAEALGGEFKVSEPVGGQEDLSPKLNKTTTKRTREEELRHIAAAKSAKEVSLKEKVLLKELKRLQKSDH